MRKLAKGLYLTEDNTIFSVEKQALSKPLIFMQGKTMEFGGKLYRFYESVQEFLEAPDGSIGIFPAYIDKVEKHKKTRYASVGDNVSHKFICKGYRKLLSGEWLKINCEPVPRNVYFVYAKRIEELVGEFHAIALKQII